VLALALSSLVALAAPSGDEALQVERVLVRGQRRVEEDAVRVNLRTAPGAVLTQDLLREDVRALWRMGLFEDVRVEVTPAARSGVTVAFVVTEKPSVRRIYVSGNEEVPLTRINEVLDLRREQVLDLARVKRNAEKIRELYRQRGFYLAEVRQQLERQPDDQVDVTFRIQENARVEVRRVSFVGNRAARDEELRAVMLTQPGDLLSFVTSAGVYREEVFQRDLLLVDAFYADRGYLRVRVGEPRFELSPDRRSLYVTVEIDEGPQYRVGPLDVTGELALDRASALAGLRLRPGQVFNRSRLQQDIQDLVERCRDRGYAHANVVPLTTIDEERRLVSVAFEVQPGRPVTVERIGIRGNTTTRDRVIRREMRLVEGDLFSQSALDLSRRRINALGYFGRVDVSTSRGSADDRMAVDVEVTEKRLGSFQVGAGFSSAESFIATVQISQDDFLGRGQRLSVQGQLSALRQIGQIQFEDRAFLDTGWSFGLSLFNQQRYYPDFTRRSLGGALSWGRALGDDVRLQLTYSLQDTTVNTAGRTSLYAGGQRSPLPAGSLANLVRGGITSAWQLALTHDTTDNRIFPRRGWHNTVSAELAEPALLSRNQYTRLQATARAYQPLLGPAVLRLRLDGGLIVSRDPQGVPLHERYFLGGSSDVRGFRPSALSPLIRVPGQQSPALALDSFRIGGNLQLGARAEIEVPLLEGQGIRAVVFSDAGNSYNLEAQYCRLRPGEVAASRDPCHGPSLQTLRAAWGFGLRWFSPLGPLRFEWGFPFRRLPGEESYVFEFNIINDL
jgi:outer membrane protein insertion porin family